MIIPQGDKFPADSQKEHFCQHVAKLHMWFRGQLWFVSKKNIEGYVIGFYVEPAPYVPSSLRTREKPKLVPTFPFGAVLRVVLPFLP